MEPVEYLRIIVRRWPIVVLVAVLGLGVGYATSKPVTAAPVHTPIQTSYDSTAILGLSSTTADPTGMSIDTMAFFATTGTVSSKTAQALHDGTTAQQVTARVQVTSKDTLNLLEVAATAPTASAAAQLANTFSGQLIAYFNDQLLSSWKATAATERSQLQVLSSVVSQLRAQPNNSVTQAELGQAQGEYVSQSVAYRQLLTAGPQHTTLHLVQPASVAGAVAVTSGGSVAAPVSSGSRKKRIALGGLAGLLVGLGLAFLWERLDTRIRTREQAERAFGVPVLAQLPRVERTRDNRLVLVERPLSGAAEAFRMLQTVLALARPPARHLSRSRVILFSSPCEVENKDVILANLAASFSEAGDSVALLAMDAFDPSLATLVSRPNPRGRRRASREGDGTIDRRPAHRGGEAAPMATVIEGVSLLLNGVTPSIGSGRAQRHMELVEQGRRVSDVVLVDTPPVLLAHDAGQLSAGVDAVVLLCPLGQVSNKDAALASEALRRVGAPLAGVVLLERVGLFSRIRRAAQAAHLTEAAQLPFEGQTIITDAVIASSESAPRRLPVPTESAADIVAIDTQGK